MLIEIDGTNYHVPDSYEEIIPADFIRFNEFAEKNLPKEEDVEAVKVKFYLDFCSYFIPKEVLKRCKVVDDDGTGLLGLFNHLWQFTQLPEDREEIAEVVTDGIDEYYFCIDSVKTSQKPLEGLTYLEFEEASSVIDAFNKLKENKLEQLITLMAIFYRPKVRKYLKKVIEPYDSDKVKDRAELFKYSLNMQQLFDCYFFLLNQFRISAIDMLTYSLNRAKQEIVK